MSKVEELQRALAVAQAEEERRLQEAREAEQQRALQGSTRLDVPVTRQEAGDILIGAHSPRIGTREKLAWALAFLLVAPHSILLAQLVWYGPVVLTPKKVEVETPTAPPPPPPPQLEQYAP